MVFFITIAVYVFLKTLLFFRAPSTLSLDEIDLLTRYNIWLPAGLPLHKIVTGICGVFVLYAVWGFLRRNKATTITQIGTLVTLATSPYFLLITNYLEVSLCVLLGCAFVLMLPNRRGTVVPIIAIVLLSIVQFGLSLIPFSELSALVDLDLLFFDAKSLPLSLTIPASGLFPFLSIIPCCVGLYGILRSALLWTQLKKGSLFVIFALFCIFFLRIPLYAKLIPLLILISFITGYGYNHLIHRLRDRVHQVIVVSLLVFPTLIGILYSTEMLMNHFDKKTSFEWGAAEMQTLNWLEDKPGRYYVTAESSKLMRYQEYYSRSTLRSITLRKVELSQMASLCSKVGSVCILRGHEIEKLKRDRQEVDYIGTFEDGLEAYYVIIQ